MKTDRVFVVSIWAEKPTAENDAMEECVYSRRVAAHNEEEAVRITHDSTRLEMARDNANAQRVEISEQVSAQTPCTCRCGVIE